MKVKKFFTVIILFNLIFMPIVDASSINEAVENIEIYAPSVVLIEERTGDVLYEKEAYTPMYPASTVKILTAILTLENCTLTEPVTISKNAISSVPSGYTVANLQVDEIMSVQDLLYALLIPSGNDAANALAEYVGGSIENFAKMMTEKASEIGCKDSFFTNPNGVHDENMHTTAYDLALIGRYAMQIEEFRTIVSTLTYTLPSTNKYTQADRVLLNTNYLINNTSTYYYEYATGMKTGYTNPARNCLVASAKQDNVELIAVILGSPAPNTGSQAKFVDAKTLFEYGFANYFEYYHTKFNNVFYGVWGAETFSNLNLVVDEEDSSSWGYVAFIIAQRTLIFIVVIYILRRLNRKIKRYKYNRKHARYKYNYRYKH